MTVAVLCAEGFEEIEAMTIVDILRRADIKTDIIGLPSKEITGAHGITIYTDRLLKEVEHDSFDALVLPGGAPGFRNLATNEHVLDFIRTMNETSKVIAAICASPFVLAKAGILKNKNATIYPGMEEEITKVGGLYKDEIVVVDEHIITSKGPATSIPFALKLVEVLVDTQTKQEIEKKLLADKVITIRM